MTLNKTTQIKRAGTNPVPALFELLLSGRVADCVEYVDIARRFHDEAIADPVVNLEDHDRARFFVRKGHFFATHYASAGTDQCIAREAIANDVTCLEYGQHVSRCEAIARASVDDHNLVRPDLRNAVNDRDDAAFDTHIRCFREEIQWNIHCFRDQAVTGECFAVRVSQRYG